MYISTLTLLRFVFRMMCAAIWSKLQCQKAFCDVQSQLLSLGHDYAAYIRQREENAGKIVDENDADHNSTVREYENVHSTSSEPVELEDVSIIGDVDAGRRSEHNEQGHIDSKRRKL